MTSPRFRRSRPGASARSASAPATSALPERRFRRTLWALAASATLILALGACGGDEDEGGAATDLFDSERAMALAKLQVELGPRPAGSKASRELAEHLVTALPGGEIERVPGGLQNVVGELPGTRPAILVAAHYDTEVTVANHVGANDGAAGTAAVVEIADALRRELPAAHREVRFALFDGEEEPLGCPDAQFAECALRGSKAYAAAHAAEIGQLILLDYVGNAGLRIPREANSDPLLWGRLREAAAEVGAEREFPATRDGEFAIIDDHIPFVEAGVPSIDLIDFTYRYADTAQDTFDKLDPEALDAVGETVTELVLQLATEEPPPS